MSLHEIAHEAYEHHRASQREQELVLALHEVAAINPQIIVEIGCDAGGTLYAWRQICDEVYGITLADNTWPTGGTCAPLVTHGAEVLLGDSHEPESVVWLLDRLAGRPVDVLHIDGDHSLAGVRTDWEMYSPLVRPGGLVLIHDVCNERDPRVQVPQFWAELTADRPDARILAKRYNPVGFGVVTIH